MEKIDDLISSMVAVKGGAFMMGDLKELYKPTFGPKIKKVLVKLDDFYIGSHTVTREEWGTVMEEQYDPAESLLPAAGHNWHQVQEFVQKLNHITQKTFRLPTEAEWEYAARGGELSDGCMYAGNEIIDLAGWFKDNSGGVIHPVCQKLPNQLGLYDMSGNVWEWCQDLYMKYYPVGQRAGLFSRDRLPVENPKGGLVGNKRVIRGGSFKSEDNNCWVFYREKAVSRKSFDDVGFRLACRE